jgi:myosin-light-chain kinase
MEPSFIHVVSDQQVDEGELATFECEVDGWPEPELSWLLDDQLIHASHDFRMEFDGQKAKLLIRDAQPDDSGGYTVRIRCGFKIIYAHF